MDLLKRKKLQKEYAVLSNLQNQKSQITNYHFTEALRIGNMVHLL